MEHGAGAAGGGGGSGGGGGNGGRLGGGGGRGKRYGQKPEEKCSMRPAISVARYAFWVAGALAILWSVLSCTPPKPMALAIAKEAQTRAMKPKCRSELAYVNSFVNRIREAELTSTYRIPKLHVLVNYHAQQILYASD